MSIWITNEDGSTELAEHSYERTLIGGCDRTFDATVAWVEGSNFEWDCKLFDFGIAGGNISTNSGLEFTKEDLLYIAENMKEGAKFKVAGCNHLNIAGVRNDFEESNNMVKTGPCQFSPKEKI